MQRARRRFIADPLRTHADTENAKAIDALDRLRRRDPDRARRRAAALAGRTLCAEAAAAALGVWATCVRRDVTKLDHATVILGTGLEIAARYDLPLTGARLALRAATIAGDRAEYEGGLSLAEWALVRYSECSDHLGIGAAHQKRGLMLGYGGRFRAAVGAFHAALFWIPENRLFRKAAAWQSLGHCYHQLGRTTDALVALEKAAQLMSSDTGVETHGRLCWVKAQVAADMGELEVADALYAKALEQIVVAELWTDAALIAAERTRVLVQRGLLGEARTFAAGLTNVVIPLQDTSPLAAAALADLIRAGMEGARLSDTLVSRTIAKIRRGRLHARAVMA